MIGINRGIGLGLGVARAGGAALWYLAGGAPLPVAAYQPIGAASLAASYTNLANPGTYNAAPGVAPTFASATGWTFNGSTQYLTTGIVPQSNYSAIIRISDVTLRAYQIPFLVDNPLWQNAFGVTLTWGIVPPKTTYVYQSSAFVARDTTSGVVALSNYGYYNGVAETVQLSTTINQTLPLYIGCRNQAGTRSMFLQGKIQAFAIYNVLISAAQVLAVTNAMNALTG